MFVSFFLFSFLLSSDVVYYMYNIIIKYDSSLYQAHMQMHRIPVQMTKVLYRCVVHVHVYVYIYIYIILYIYTCTYYDVLHTVIARQAHVHVHVHAHLNEQTGGH